MTTAAEVTVRHTHASGIQDYAREKADALREAFPRIEHVHIILDVEKHRHVAECIVQVKKHANIEADETSDNFKSAIDIAIERAERQLRKLEDRIQEHRGHS
jgi:putative sigma-54 modulation protein